MLSNNVICVSCKGNISEPKLFFIRILFTNAKNEWFLHAFYFTITYSNLFIL